MSDKPLEQDAERLVKIYRRIREAREQATAKYKAQDAEWEAQQKQAGQMLIALMDEQGALGLKTSQGTVTKTVKNKFWNTDWSAFNQFVKERDLFDLYEHRLAQKNVAEFMAANPDVVIPGLQTDRRYDVIVRKPTEKGGEDE